MNPQMLGADPVPGDPEQARRISALMATVEARALEIGSRLRSIESGVGPQMWRGEAADGFAALVAATGPDLTTLAASYGAASQALATYATELAAAQDTARAAQAEASTASAARDRGAADRDSARSDADRHAAAAADAQLLLDPVGAQDAEQRRGDALGRENAARAAIDQADQALLAARRKADEAAGQRAAAAARCVRELDDASRAGIETRNLAQPATAAGTLQAVTAGANPLGLRTIGNGTGAAPAAAAAGIGIGTDDGTGTGLAVGAALAGTDDGTDNGTGTGLAVGAALAGTDDGTDNGTGTGLAVGAALAGAVAGHRVLGSTGLLAAVLGANPLPPAAANAARNAAWWRALGPLQEQVLQMHPEWVGNRDGIPAADRDTANRIVLEKEITRLDRELASAAARWQAAGEGRLPPEMKDQDQDEVTDRLRLEVERLGDQRNALAAVSAAVAPPPDAGQRLDGQQQGVRQLLVLDLSGVEPRAAVAVGNIDTADHVAVFTPGFTTTVASGLENYVNDMQETQKVARRQLFDARRPDESVATVAWLGYDAPQRDTVLDRDRSVVMDDAARRGATQLAGFLDGINASRLDDPHLTALGHSYGSTTTGYALQQVDGVDDAVLFGSPGAGTRDIADLRVPPGHVAVLEAREDVVADSGIFGVDPNQIDGVANLSAREETAPDGRPLLESKGHSEYLNSGTTSQYNIAATVAGLPERRITGDNTDAGDLLEAIPGTNDVLGDVLGDVFVRPGREALWKVID